MPRRTNGGSTFATRRSWQASTVHPRPLHEQEGAGGVHGGKQPRPVHPVGQPAEQDQPASCSGDIEKSLNLLPRISMCEPSAHRRLFPICSSDILGFMDDDLRPVPRREFLFDVEQALRNAAKLWPRKHVPGDHDRLRPVANAVVEYLALCGIRCFRKILPIGHIIPPGPRPSGEEEIAPKG